MICYALSSGKVSALKSKTPFVENLCFKLICPFLYFTVSFNRSTSRYTLEEIHLDVCKPAYLIWVALRQTHPPDTLFEIDTQLLIMCMDASFHNNSHSVGHCRYVTLQIPGDQSSPVWKATFAAITDKDFLLYESAPFSREDWASPHQSHSILATRYSYVFQK